MLGQKIGKKFITREIKKPIKPMAASPIAATLAVVLYSFMSGFLKILQTLPHCAKNEPILNIKLVGKAGF